MNNQQNRRWLGVALEFGIEANGHKPQKPDFLQIMISVEGLSLRYFVNSISRGNSAAP